MPAMIWTFHPLPEARHIIYALGLDEVDAGGGLFCRAQRPEFEGIGKGIGRSADKHIDVAFDLFLSAHQCFFVAHRFYHMDQLHGIQIMDVLCMDLIPEGMVIAGETDDVLDAERGRAEQVALHGDTVPVAGHHLHHRLHSHLNDKGARSDTGHAHDGGLVVRNVDRVDITSQEINLSLYDTDVIAFGRSQFGGDGKMSVHEYLL
jgi:hypothetical protein